MKFTSLFRRPPHRDVLIRFFKAGSVLREVTFNLLFYLALYSEWTIAAHSTATSVAEQLRTSTVFFCFFLFAYIQRGTKSLCQVWEDGWNHFWTWDEAALNDQFKVWMKTKEPEPESNKNSGQITLFKDKDNILGSKLIHFLVES